MNATILLPVDPAYALDYLAILQVKRTQGLSVAIEHDRVYNALKVQIQNLVPILTSPEYARLVEANLATFNMVELAKTDACSASGVDRANYDRYLAKRALQSRFWPDSPVAESKTPRPYA